MKICSKCNELKSLDQFNKDRSRKDDLQCWCRTCQAEYRKDNHERMAEYSKRHYEANRERKAEYYEANRDRITEYSKQWREANRERMVEYYEANRERKAEYRKANRKRIAEYHKQWYEANRDRITEYSKQWREANRDRYAEYRKQYRANDPAGVYQLTCLPTGDVYFGQTGAVNHRRRDHFSDIANQCHGNPHIQALSMSYCEPDDWHFEVLMLVDDEQEQLAMEASLIEKFNCLNVKCK